MPTATTRSFISVMAKCREEILIPNTVGKALYPVIHLQPYGQHLNQSGSCHNISIQIQATCTTPIIRHSWPLTALTTSAHQTLTVTTDSKPITITEASEVKELLTGIDKIDYTTMKRIKYDQQSPRNYRAHAGRRARERERRASKYLLQYSSSFSPKTSQAPPVEKTKCKSSSQPLPI